MELPKFSGRSVSGPEAVESLHSVFIHSPFSFSLNYFAVYNLRLLASWRSEIRYMYLKN